MKLLKEPLFYLLPLLVLAYFFTIPQKIESSNAILSYSDKVEEINLPFSKNLPATDFTVFFDLFIHKKSRAEYKIVPDDCLSKIIIDGKEVNLDKIKDRCDYRKGISIDLNPYLKVGNNHIEIQVKNNGGLAALHFDYSEKLGMRHFFFTFILLLNAFLLLRKFKFGFRAAFIVLLGIAIRLFFYNATMPGEFTYDFEGHLEYVKIIAEENRIPATNECWSCYHPPLYYAAASFANDNLNLMRQIQLLFSFLTISFGVAIICRLFGKNFYAFLSSLIFVLYPGFILASARISNEIPFYFFSLFSLYFMNSWWHKQKNSYFILATLGASLAFACKSTGFVILGIWFIVYICGIFKYFKIGSIKYLTIGAAIVLLSFGFANHRSISDAIDGKKFELIGNISGLNSGLSVNSEPGNYVYFDLQEYLLRPYLNPWRDEGGRQYFWNYALKSSLFGEFAVFNSPIGKFLATLISLTSLLLFMCVIWGIINSKRNDFVMLVFFFALWAALLYVRIKYPFSATTDFRFIMPAVVPIAYFSVNGIKNINNHRVRILMIGGLSAFTVLSFLFIILKGAGL